MTGRVRERQRCKAVPVTPRQAALGWAQLLDTGPHNEWKLDKSFPEVHSELLERKYWEIKAAALGGAESTSRCSRYER